jgi:hypothetical protein
MPLRGSLLLFLSLTALFLVSAVAIGVLIAAVSKTLQQALLLSFFGLFPAPLFFRSAILLASRGSRYDRLRLMRLRNFIRALPHLASYRTLEPARQARC